jgi:D-alanine-D-alanine ligase
MATSPDGGAAGRTLVLVYGGRSAEHDISRVSARAVFAAAASAGFGVEAVAVGRDGIWRRPADLDPTGRSLPDSLPVDGEEVAASLALTGVVFPMVHGPLGEDGTLAGLCELVDVPYVGCGVLSSALCMDKAMAKRVIAEAGLPQARAIALGANDPLDPDAVLADLGAPVFVKPANMGSSVGVSRAVDVDDLVDAVALARTYDEWVVIEEEVVGREIECAVLGAAGSARASLPGEVVAGAEFYDYADKYLTGVARTEVPADLDPGTTAEVQRLAVAAFDALRCEGMARVDFFLSSERGLLLNEVNTVPGFTPISMYPSMWAASGVPLPTLVRELVALAVDRHARRPRRTDVGGTGAAGGARETM